MKRKQTNPK